MITSLAVSEDSKNGAKMYREADERFYAEDILYTEIESFKKGTVFLGHYFGYIDPSEERKKQYLPVELFNLDKVIERKYIGIKANNRHIKLLVKDAVISCVSMKGSHKLIRDIDLHSLGKKLTDELVCDAHLEFKNFEDDILFVVATETAIEKVKVDKVEPNVSGSAEWLFKQKSWIGLGIHGHNAWAGVTGGVRHLENFNLSPIRSGKVSFKKTQSNLVLNFDSDSESKRYQVNAALEFNRAFGFDRFQIVDLRVISTSKGELPALITFLVTDNLIMRIPRRSKFAYSLSIDGKNYLVLESINLQCNKTPYARLGENSLKKIDPEGQKLFSWLEYKENKFLLKRHSALRNFYTPGSCDMTSWW